MSKKNNKIAVRKFAEIVNVDNIVTIPLEGVEGVDIEIKRTISFQEMLDFVESVAALCVNIETSQYYPHLRDFGIKMELLTRYANFTLPQSIDKKYEYIYNSNAVALVLANINETQFTEIVSSIDSKIRFALEEMNSAATKSVTSLISKLDVAVDESAAMFEGIDHDEVMKMIDNIDIIASKDEVELAKGVKQAISED